MYQVVSLVPEDQTEVEDDQSVVIGYFTLKGPFHSYIDCLHEPGILAVLKTEIDGSTKILNAYHTADVRTSASLEMAYYWQDGSKILVAAYYSTTLTAQLSTNLAALILASGLAPIE